MIQFDFPWIFTIPYLFLFGAIVGSFLNVCVYRLPQHESFWGQIRGLWSPPSHCPRCGKRIWRQDNLPVIGWIRLRGRCRFCRTRISSRYPLIEAANGLLFVLVFFCEVPTGFNRTIAESCVYSSLGPQGDLQSTLFSPTMVVLWRWLYHMVLIESLLVATLIDFDLRIIPDGVTLPAMAVGVLGGFLLGRVYLVPVWFQDVGMTDTLASLVDGTLGSLFTGPPIPEWIGQHPHLHGLAVSLAGILVGGGSIWIVRIIGHWVLKREAMGFGDVVLMATIGSFLGWQPTLIVFFVAPVCALAVVIVGWVFRRDREIPYGPYLSLAALVVLLDWKRLWPPAEQVFSLGLVVPMLGIVMCVMLFFSLQLTQWSKRLLGISDFFPEDDELQWQSADQLFHYARDNADHTPPHWQQSRWPGLGAGRGSLHEQRWRNGH